MASEKQDQDERALQLLKKVEADLDTNYHRFPLPDFNRAIATWYSLTVLEDSMRSLFVLSEEAEASIVEVQIDRLKYSVRFALGRIGKECVDISASALPIDVVPEIYEKTQDLLFEGVQFMAATQLCSAAHTGTVSFQDNGASIEVIVDRAQEDPRYAALEIMGYKPVDSIDHSANFYVWIRAAEFRPTIADDIARSVRIAGKQVRYEYVQSLAIALGKQMSEPPRLLPKEWVFPWGGRHDTRLLINALCLRCMYHLVAVHFGAALNNLPGAGEASILHVTTEFELVFDLRQMCSLDEGPVRSFVQYLTYGYRMNTPDPALQPIVTLGSGLIGVPCLMFLSSNYERNLLSLQARIDSASFDANSKLFEDSMVQELLCKILPHWPIAKGNVTVRSDGGFEEIDLLIADTDNQTLLVCELRWMLQPGDPREVQTRKKVCHEKVAQLARKTQWLSSKVAAALTALGLTNISADGWTVEGVVVVQTFGGTLSKDDRLPVMPAHLFAQGLLETSSLKHFSQWSQSLQWLPQEDLHFSIVHTEVDLSALRKRMSCSGIQKLCSVRTYSEFVTQSLARKTA